MKINSVFVFILLWFSVIHAQDQEPWKKINPSVAQTTARLLGKLETNNPILFQFDEETLKTRLEKVQDKTLLNNTIQITVPNAKGVLEKFAIREDSNFEPELQAKYPDIRSYSGTGITDPSAVLNFSMSPLGIQTMITRNGNQMEFIEKDTENNDVYVVFDSKSKLKERLPFSCATDDELALTQKISSQTAKLVSSDKKFRTLRLALSCTGEYAVYHGGTVSLALAAMNATMTRVNGIFSRDLAVKLLIITNNNLVIYTNASTDPYSPSSTGVGDENTDGKWGTELQANLTSVIGSANYDIGHLFGATGGGGNAGCIGCVCDAGKGSAYTSPSNGVPKGDTFDIDFVAHEMGHQLGANHTFSYDIEGTGVSIEPGSGSTIMGYAGITTDYDVEQHSTDYFSFASISQIQNNLASKICPVVTTISAAAPTVNAGADYTIPKGTAFVLKGTGGSSSSATYVWEENDSATSASGDLSFALSTKTNGPLFRSFPPVNTPVRYMPSFENVLAGRLTSKWESVSTVARTLHFVLTARDNAAEGLAQTLSDEMVVNVSGTAGPFEVTSQNIDNLSWFQNTNQIITWNVNGTDALAGSSKVNIKLSTDNGVTFPVTLASAVANDGSETISVPNVSSQYCRILIEPTDNIYYAINSKTFAIGYTVESSCQTYDFLTTPFNIPEQGSFASKTITVSSTTSSVLDVNVNIDISHTYFSDVQMELVSPQGTVVKLFYNGCGTTNGHLLLNYDDAGGDLSCGNTVLQTVAPLGVLGDFNGENPQGTWTLRIRDIYTNDTGVLNAASVSICTQNYTLVPYDEITQDLRVSSNPNDGNFNVKYISTSSNNTIEILVYNVSGKRIFNKKYPNNGGFDEDIQLPNKPQAGIYFVTLIDGDTKKTTKMIVN
ncbi:T9SS type A sorting domain-containing protein [Flavobacterium sufflavum]|uniref:T9SS type A sorting domain-containing protein n=1 Tax=Flavobacterium sufflavum TaxID=1921138 RepID=A0A437L379_9FLAO|nr:zinc-dependent metalloprotease family protein [Flavobacterium sufflavum]RVT79772.1 T9SS type A sorting domain-containing protein [Flavobacterium sufflavum]